MTFGIPLETQLFLTLPFAGIGIVGFVNLNLKGSFYGLAFSLQFGNLR